MSHHDWILNENAFIRRIWYFVDLMIQLKGARIWCNVSRKFNSFLHKENMEWCAHLRVFRSPRALRLTLCSLEELERKFTSVLNLRIRFSAWFVSNLRVMSFSFGSKSSKIMKLLNGSSYLRLETQKLKNINLWLQFGSNLVFIVQKSINWSSSLV